MTEDKSRGWFRGGARDTTQLDLAQGTPVLRTATDSRQADGRPGVHDTVQVDPSVFAAERVPSPAVSSGDRAPDPLGDTGSVDVSAIRMRTVEQHLDEILGAVPQPDPIELGGVPGTAPEPPA